MLVQVISSNLEGTVKSLELSSNIITVSELLSSVKNELRTFSGANWESWALRGAIRNGEYVEKFAIQPSDKVIALSEDIQKVYQLTDVISAEKVRLSIAPLKFEGGIILSDEERQFLIDRYNGTTSKTIETVRYVKEEVIEEDDEEIEDSEDSEDSEVVSRPTSVRDFLNGI